MSVNDHLRYFVKRKPSSDGRMEYRVILDGTTHFITRRGKFFYYGTRYHVTLRDAIIHILFGKPFQ